MATALVVVVALAGLGACRTVAQVMRSSNLAGQSADALERQTAQFRNEAATAFAVFVPPDAGERAAGGAQLDFYARTDAGRAIYWRYVYDPAAQTLQRSDYDPGGASGVRDAATGEIDPRAAYPPLGGITRFTATALTADRLGDPAVNPYHGIAGILGHTPAAHTVGYPDALAAAAGGNGVVQVELAQAGAERVVHLAAGTMPTGFTVTAAPVWHAIVYRLDQSHRFLLGLGSKSHVFINARVDVSYDGWQTRIAWCDFNLLGNPDGLDPHDPHADYKPNEALESAPNILAACRRRHPLLPTAGSADNPPDADAVHPPLPGQTAPPCWTRPGPAGRCWPANAPPDWVPPAPLPADPPPAAWCGSHRSSPACSAAGPPLRARLPVAGQS